MRYDTIVVDSNLLILLVVGQASTKYIDKHKGLKAYTIKDYELLLRFVDSAKSMILTPNILTETSNIAPRVYDEANVEIRLVLRKLIERLDETYIPSESASMRSEFPRLGLTDASIVELCSNGATLLTDDVGLFVAVLENGGDALNFNHVREYAWKS